MRMALFKRIHNTPMRVRPVLSGSIMVVSPGETIKAEYDTFKDVLGFQFISFCDDSPHIDQPSYVSKTIVMYDVKREKSPPIPTVIGGFEESSTESEIIDTPDNSEIAKVLAELSSFNNKKWTFIKNDVLHAYLKILEVDTSLIPNSRVELIKALKQKVSELTNK